jgi:N-methylhydantoinase B/oxoprolinase/acetone carboxylase alpha subunit
LLASLRGGYGDPASRDPAARAHDAAEGLTE